MTEQTTTDPKPPKDPRGETPPCGVCDSDFHTTGQHNSGAPPAKAQQTADK